MSVRDWRAAYNSEKTRARYAAMRDVLRERKNAPCVDCGGRFPSYVMEFDHVRGEKIRPVGMMVSCSLKTLLTEITKCDLVCSNCHQIRTHLRRQAKRRAA